MSREDQFIEFVSAAFERLTSTDTTPEADLAELVDAAALDMAARGFHLWQRARSLSVQAPVAPVSEATTERHGDVQIIRVRGRQ